MKLRLLTTVVDEGGQSVLEFAFLLPVLMGLVALMIKVNMAMQISIVNQQYARAHIHWLTFNSAIYPAISQRNVNFTPLGYNQMVIGVAGNPAPEESSESYRPIASTQNITRDPKNKNVTDEERAEPSERAKVRVRNTVALCTQSNVIGGDGGNHPITPDSLRTFGEGQGLRAQIFQYCRSPLDE